MRKFALIAIVSIVAVSGAVSPAFATLSDRDDTIRRQTDAVQVAARGGGDKGGRNDGGKNSGGKGRDARTKNDSKVIWRIRDGKHRPFFLFRGRGDCRTEAVPVRDSSGDSVLKQAWVCN